MENGSHTREDDLTGTMESAESLTEEEAVEAVRRSMKDTQGVLFSFLTACFLFLKVQLGKNFVPNKFIFVGWTLK